ncbi:hypothetical protein BJ993_001381 [Nocardioides aromaticivorans]|uniref:Uncharacterized protein n=1 Tax=Nocardioides aromaticivorans TaxID=200618 RepID=A0A7Y9ZFZ2_9ACTN|nr:hypothetical protein [Nocardioides aromaticivorans]NYI44301.1 hypothetical protein [Nocardioides aromaticivorans]
MSQPPYGVPPQPGPPQGAPGAPPPPAYLGGGAPGPVPGQPPAYGGPPAGYGGPGLPPPPASAKRTIGFVMGLITALALIACVVVVWLITANN